MELLAKTVWEDFFMDAEDSVSLDASQCCPDRGSALVVDYSTVAGNARRYLERHALIKVGRSTVSRFDPGALASASLPAYSPFPAPSSQYALIGDPAPDHGRDWHWPISDGESGQNE